MPSDIAHPVSVPFTTEEVARRFVQFRPSVPTPLWQCELLVERSHRVGPINEEPKPGGPMTSLALLNRPDPSCDLEILAQWLDAEIDPADWLDLWLAQQKITPISVKRVGTLSGHIGDVIGSWTIDGVQWLGRFFCLKAGPRLAMLWFRARAADYPRVADDFFLSIATFSFVDESPGPLAEKVRWVTNSLPIGWRVAIPVSWAVVSEPASPQCASFQANLLSSATPPVLLGKLSYAVTSADQATTHEEALAKAIAAVSEAGVKLSSQRIVSEKPSPPFSESWLVFAGADIGGQAGEFRCRIMRHPRVWVMAVVLSVDAASSPQAWMRAMRLLNVATSTIEFT